MAWWESILRLVIAVVIGCVIGIEREHRHRPAGMRTHVLVCVGASIIAVLETLMLNDTVVLNGAGAVTGVAVSRGRMAAQVISGIGFLGAGTIFVSKKKITGLTTAASLWNTACLGLAIGMGYYGLAVAGCAAVMTTLTLMRHLITPRVLRHMEIQYAAHADVNTVNTFFQSHGVQVIDADVHVTKGKDKSRRTTIQYTLDVPSKTDLVELINQLAAQDHVESVRLGRADD